MMAMLPPHILRHNTKWVIERKLKLGVHVRGV
jgi:hypothetical protein